MNSADTTTEYLFSYGSLQQEAVQLATYGRKLKGQPDALAGYCFTLIPVKAQNAAAHPGVTHHRNLQLTGSASDLIEGTVFTLSPAELVQTDGYEAPDDYHRVPVQLRSGIRAWVYRNLEAGELSNNSQEA
ncbi:MAG: gamma-glutamylcyclotransferase family protein [Blastocatellia bacterium]